VVDRVTGTVLFGSSCDPVGANPFGEQLFAMRLDGSGLRQLTATRGMTTDSDGTVRVEMVGPFAYPVGRPSSRTRAVSRPRRRGSQRTSTEREE
jgi:hypothetical protein